MGSLAGVGDLIAVRNRIHGERNVYFWCPGCKSLHFVSIDRPGWSSWDWNGSYESPTFTPSIMVIYGLGKNENRCHLFVRNGNLEYLADSVHRYRAQIIKMVPIPPGTFIS